MIAFNSEENIIDDFDNVTNDADYSNEIDRYG